MIKNYYEVLGVSEQATIDEIKKQFYKLSKEYHPDVNPNGEEIFKEVNEAYEVLKNYESRSQHDRLLASQRQPKFTNRVAKEFLHIIIKREITVTESYLGTIKNINFTRDVKCQPCNGHGGEVSVCHNCSGAGVITQTFGNSFFSQMVTLNCPTCSGRGYIITKPCESCKGKGTTTKSFQQTISIPKNTNTDFYSFRGMGNESANDVGDLMLELIVVEDDFRREGNNLIHDKILVNNEVFATEIYVPHPEGKLRVFLPKNFDTRTPIRIKGKGFNNGDFLINIVVKIER